MARVFVDTNVLLSGFIFRGNESAVLEMALRGEIRLVLAEAVMDEARRVLERKFPGHANVVDELLDFIECDTVPFPSTSEIAKAARKVRDPHDAVILASISDSRPDVALSGDRDLLTPDLRAEYGIQTCGEYLRARA